MHRLLPLLFALSAVAQTRTIDGIVKTAAGAPLPGMTVAVTLLPIADAEDITATETTDAAGGFHFAQLKYGKYGVAATSASACGGATSVDVTNDPQRMRPSLRTRSAAR
ncbi:MAG TPA: carboxypeptidase-like regulatory domain-containing protein [Thermoanaerobaculia bacterium]|nr:carboxypeptidase-like regulatory domain-containing protein [Thermoanaerobaculia bacterium]